MRRILLAALVLSSAACLAQEKITTTGWFADDLCVRGRAARGEFKPNNPDCAMDCIKKGAKTVLVAPNEKTLYVIANPTLTTEHFAEHVQVVGLLNAKTNTLTIDSIKDLGDYVGPACMRKKKSQPSTTSQ